MSRRRLLALLAGAAALPAAAVVGWLVASALSPSPPPVRPQATQHDPLAGLPRDEALRLVSPLPDAPSPFVTLPLVKPEPFCKWLQTIGLQGTSFELGAPPFRGWNCVADLVKPVGGEDAEVSSLFVTARGIDPDRLETIRLKLNLIAPATAPLVKDIARDFLRTMFRGLGAEIAPEALSALDGPSDLKITARGVAYDLKREPGPTIRANLIVTFPRTLGLGGEARFLPAPRGGWRR